MPKDQITGGFLNPNSQGNVASQKRLENLLHQKNIVLLWANFLGPASKTLQNNSDSLRTISSIIPPAFKIMPQVCCNWAFFSKRALSPFFQNLVFQSLGGGGIILGGLDYSSLNDHLSLAAHNPKFSRQSEVGYPGKIEENLDRIYKTHLVGSSIFSPRKRPIPLTDLNKSAENPGPTTAGCHPLQVEINGFENHLKTSLQSTLQEIFLGALVKKNEAQFFTYIPACEIKQSMDLIVLAKPKDIPPFDSPDCANNPYGGGEHLSVYFGGVSQNFRNVASNVIFPINKVLLDCIYIIKTRI